MGEVIRIHDNGHPVARLVPDAEFMPGAAAASFFKVLEPDPAVASAIAMELQKLEVEAQNALDYRH